MGQKKGFKHTEETRKKMSESCKNRKLWNEGLTKNTDKRIKKHSKYLSKLYTNRKLNETHKKNISKALLGRKIKEESIEKWRKKRKGFKHTMKSRIKMSVAKTGINEKDFKGFSRNKNQMLRISSMYKIWREAVFLRDNFTCQNKNCEYCNNKTGVYVHAHHIKPLSKFPELAFKINNGITYCAEFHLKSDIHKEINQV